MGNIVAQNASTDVVCGPFLNAAGSTVADLAIANTQIVIVKEGSVSVARNDAVSATSVGPGLQKISLNATDTNTLGTITIWVSASAMLPYVKQIEVWNSVTWNAYYGADPLLGSAATSVLIQAALVNYDVPTSADISAIVTVVMKNVLTNMDIATSTGVSGLVSIVGSAVAGRALTNYQAPTSATLSVVVAGVLTNYQALTSAAASALISVVVKNALTLGDIATSAGVSVEVSAILNSYNVASVGDIAGGGVDYASISGLITQALTNYQVMTSAGTSALISVVVKNALTLGDVATSAGVSTEVSNVLSQWISDVSGRLSGIAFQGARGALSNWEAPTSAVMSVIIQGVLTNYDVPTSADISAIVGPAVWNRAAAEPTTAPDWGSVSRGTGFDWLVARSLNRHSQTASTIEIYTSAGPVMASASVSNNSVSATRDQFRG